MREMIELSKKKKGCVNMGVVFIASLFEMMDLQCKVYFNRDNMPSDKLVMNHSDVGIFPEDNIIFINIENIDDPTQFYFLLSKCAYELKHNKNVPLVEMNKRSDIFANYIIGLVFGAQIVLDKYEETERILVEIENEYPFQKVQPIIEQVEYEMEMLSEYDEEDSNTTLVS